MGTNLLNDFFERARRATIVDCTDTRNSPRIRNLLPEQNFNAVGANQAAVLNLLLTPLAEPADTAVVQDLLGELREPEKLATARQVIKIICETHDRLEFLLEKSENEKEKENRDVRYQGKNHLELSVSQYTTPLQALQAWQEFEKKAQESIWGMDTPEELIAVGLLKSLGSMRTDFEDAFTSLGILHDKLFADVKKQLEALHKQLPEWTMGQVFEEAKEGENTVINALRAVVAEIKDHIPRFAELTAIAGVANENGYAEAEIDAQQSWWQNGYHLKYQRGDHTNPAKGRQIANDRVADSPAVVFNGSNMSGKSFALDTHWLMHRMSQATGHLSAKAGATKRYDTFCRLDRAVTDAWANLSAFGKEGTNWQKVFSGLGERSLIISDEAFSTTDPEEQAVLLEALIIYLRQRHADIILATHSEDFTENTAGDSAIGYYHLETHFDQEGKLVFDHRLKEGPADSAAIEVARGFGFDPKILADAEAYLRGESLHPDTPQRKIVPVASYTDEDREALKREKSSVDPRAMAHARILVRNKEERYRGRKLRNRYRKDSDDYKQDPAKAEKRPSESYFLFTGKPEGESQLPQGKHMPLFGELGHIANQWMRDKATSDSRELFERQRFFRTLVEDPQLRESLQKDANKLIESLWGRACWRADSEVVQGGLAHLIQKIAFDLRTEEDFSGGNDPETRERKKTLLTKCHRAMVDLATETGMLDEGYVEKQQQLSGIIDELKIALEQYTQSRSRIWKEENEKLPPEKKDDWSFAFDTGLRDRVDQRAYEEHKAIFIDLSDRLQAAGVVIGDGVATKPEYYLKSAQMRLNALVADHVVKKPLTGFDAETQAKVVGVLSGLIDEINELYGETHRYPEIHAAFVEATLMAQANDPFADFLSRLRQIDAVPAHQMANHLEEVFDAVVGKGDKSGKKFVDDELQQVASKRYSKYQGIHRDDLQKLFSITHELRALFRVAETIAQNPHRFCPVEWAEQPEMHAEGLWNPQYEHEPRNPQTPNAMHLPKGTMLELNTGATMSGKTFSQKQAMWGGVMFGQAFGYGCASSLKMPIFAGAVGIKRESIGNDPDLSAFGNDIVTWNRALTRLGQKTSTQFITVDEGFSTTSPRYMGALSAATCAHLIEQGHMAMYATHHHAAIERMLADFGDQANATHHQVELDNQGEISFTHHKIDGHAPSYSYAVLKKLGIDPEFLDIVEQVRQRHERESIAL